VCKSKTSKLIKLSFLDLLARLTVCGGGGIWTRVHQCRTRASPGASTFVCSWPAGYLWPCQQHGRSYF